MDTNGASRELLTIEQYLALSAKINYQLSARALNKPALLALILGPIDFPRREQEVLLKAIDVLQAGYQQDRRRLGTPGILHPLRAAAILARSVQQPTLLHLLGGLLHDKDEDLVVEQIGSDRYDEMDGYYQELLDRLRGPERERLERSVKLLCATDYPTYQDYLVSIVDAAPELPEVLHVKLADRIDNTFDINLQHPGVTRYNFYRAVFDILFMPGFRGIEMGSFHFMPDSDEGVMLLSQLFKDTFFLALLRATGLDVMGEATRRLFIGLAVAGIREAQWLALEMFNTCITEVEEQRALLISVMQYCAEGGTASVRSKGAAGELDGMLLESFLAGRRGEQKKMLAEIFGSRDLLAKMVLAFIVVFASFINNPQYTIQGIGRTGVEPVPAGPDRA